MKPRVNWTGDRRIRNSNGVYSKSRQLVCEALEAAGNDGATKEQIVDYVKGDLAVDHPLMSVGQALGFLAGENFVVESMGKFWLKENYSPIGSKPAQNGHSKQEVVSPHTQKRAGRVVSLFTAPQFFVDVVEIKLLIGNTWIPVPLFGNVRVCIGDNIPDWSNVVWYNDVKTAKFIFRDGHTHEEQPSGRDIVSVAQAE